MIVASAEPLYEQRNENIVKSARERAEPHEFRQEERKEYRYWFFLYFVFRGSEIAERAVLTEMNFMALDVLRHRTLRESDLARKARADK